MASANAAAGGADKWLPYVVGVVVAVLGGGGLAALMKSRPEGSKILVDAAQGVVLVQTGVIDRLNRELGEARAQIAELGAHMAEMSSLREGNDRLKARVSELERQNARLKRRVSELEHKG
ncbi:MAG TPA: hypothetical protein VIV12_30885 [Streptosporangiaceae bacterium]